MGVEPVLTGSRLGSQDWTTPGCSRSVREIDQGRGTGKGAAASRKLYRRRHPNPPACQGLIRPHCTFTAHPCNPVEAPPNDQDRSFGIKNGLCRDNREPRLTNGLFRLVAWLPKGLNVLKVERTCTMYVDSRYVYVAMAQVVSPWY